MRSLSDSITHQVQIIVIPVNPSKYLKGGPFYLKGIASKTVGGVQTHSDVTIGTLHLKQLSLVVVSLALSFPVIIMDAMTQCHATWNKPKFLAFLVGL